MQKKEVDIYPCPRCGKCFAIIGPPQRIDKSRIRVYLNCVKCGWRETAILSLHNLRLDNIVHVKHT